MSAEAKEHLVSPQPIRKYELSFPTELPQDFKEIRERFQKAETLIIPTGTFGLGDSVMELRYAIELARKSGKKAVIQVHPSLVDVLERFGLKDENITFVEKVSESSFLERNVFFLTFMQVGDLQNSDTHRWAEADYHFRPWDILRQAQKDDLYIDIKTIAPKGKLSWNKVLQSYGFEGNALQTAESMMALEMMMLGVPIQPGELDEQPFLEMTKDEVDAIPQDLEYLFVPDAKEMPSSFEKRSMKSMSVEMWDSLFSQLPAQTKIGIVLGVSHPEYCAAVIAKAREYDLDIEVISQPLQDLVKTFLRVKVIFGMDSGTTHLAKEAVRAARLHGREIALRSALANEKELIASFAIAEEEVFAVENKRNRGFLDMEELTPSQKSQLIQFALKGKERE